MSDENFINSHRKTKQTGTISTYPHDSIGLNLHTRKSSADYRSADPKPTIALSLVNHIRTWCLVRLTKINSHRKINSSSHTLTCNNDSARLTNTVIHFTKPHVSGRDSPTYRTRHTAHTHTAHRLNTDSLKTHSLSCTSRQT